MPELHVTHDRICMNETVLDSSTEQSVELDYLLPDYCPGIFKLLKTRIDPKIQSQSISGSKLYLDGISTVQVLYLAEETNIVCAIEQILPFSKTIDLTAECTQPTICITPRCYFVNARVINSRRLEVRGGISCKIRVTEPKAVPAVCGGEGAGLQFHQIPLTLCDQRRAGSKSFTVTEELELGAAKPAFQSLLHYHCTVVPVDYKIIANKVICKGELNLHLLYLPAGEASIPETMDYSVPISQIVDVPGIEETYSCHIRFDAVSVSLQPKPVAGDENRLLVCEMVLHVDCIGERNREVLLADDLYSTQFETTASVHPMTAERWIRTIHQPLLYQQKLEVDSDRSISAVYDAFCQLTEYSTRWEEATLRLTGKMDITVLCSDKDNISFVIDRTVPIDLPLDKDALPEEALCDPIVEIRHTGYTISSPTALELRTELSVNGNVYERIRCNIISDVAINEESPVPADPHVALRLYYAEAGESIWEIAKGFKANLSAVQAENDLESDCLAEPVMLLIPLSAD